MAQHHVRRADPRPPARLGPGGGAPIARWSGPVIDAHHHLWARAPGTHPWLDRAAEGPDPGLLAHDWLPTHHAAALAGHRVAATVHVEAGVSDDLPGWETAWLDRSDRAVVAARHVARVDLTRPEAPERVAEEARHPRIAGIRHILSWHPDPALRFAPRPGIAAEPAFRAGLRAVRDAGLAFDLMIYPRQVDEAEALVRAFPDMPVVLDHCGSPVDRSPEGMALWRAGLHRLGKLPNLRLKISNPFAYDPCWTPASTGVVLDACLAAFGPGRCLFGTDAPVSARRIAPGTLLDLYLDHLADLSRDEQRAVFHDTAAATYRLPLTAA